MELAITSLTSNKQEWNTCFSQLNYPQCKVKKCFSCLQPKLNQALHKLGKSYFHVR